MRETNSCGPAGALRHSIPEGRWFAAIVESSDDAIIGKDLNGTVETWNSGAERLYGYSRQEIIGCSMDLLLPADRRQEEKIILKGIQNGERFEHFETVRKMKSGELVDVSLTISPIRNSDGEIVGASHIARNISERLKLDRVASQLAAIVASSLDAIVGKSLEGIVQTWNRAAETLYGYRETEILGKQISILLPPDRPNEEREILQRIRLGERIEHFETVRVRKDGKLVTVSLSVSPIRDSHGRIRGASHIARDITEQKAFEARMQQVQKLESLGVLAGGVAHDFNNLLTGILGNASLALERLPRVSPIRSNLESVSKAAERAATLTRQLLAYAGKGNYIVEKIDVSELVRETAQLIEASIPKKVQVLLKLNGHLPSVDGDVGQLQQVIMNLIINGAEAIAEDTGTVVVRTWLQEADDLYIQSVLPGADLAPGLYVALEVHDTGCGMEEEMQARIFDPFFTTKFTGRGLGLAAVLGIIRSHRGALKVYSKPGEGSTFKVLLPVSPDELDALDAAKPALDPLRGRGHILVVDDDEMIGRFTQGTLEHFGYSATVVRSGTEALAVFSQNPHAFRMILLDLTMPGMGGEEMFRQLRTFHTEVPVVLMSGYSEAAAVRNFTGKGLAGFIQKPFSARQVAEVVRAVLQDRGETAGQDPR